MRFMCVCKYCSEHTSDEATIELNFRDNKIYFMCPSCKKINTLDLSPKINSPLPKSRFS